MVSDSSLPPQTIADQPGQQPAKAAQLDADALLQASRRVDWRFLLPDPNLGHVGYLGPARGALLDSLRLFSAALTLVDASLAQPGVEYDVVVAHRPALPALRLAASLVRPDGFLYVEAYGPLKRRRAAGGLRFAADHIVALERLGLADAAAYWHWPNFEACAEIVPLADRDALRLAFARRRSGAGARLKSALGHALLASGLFARLAPCYSIVARKKD